jgi:uncharacterized membrane protein
MQDPSLFARLRSAFLAGLLLLAPLAVTLIVFSWLVGQVGGRFRDYFFFFVPSEWIDHRSLGLLWDVLSTCIAVALITLLGLVSRWVLGRYFGTMAERFIRNIPGVGLVYNTVKQIVTTFTTQNRAVFSRTVLVQFPRAGSYAIGFLTNIAQGEVQARTAEELWTVFVPTTPNPTSGFLVMLPRRDIIELEMSIGDGMKLIISGGAVTPPWPMVGPVPVHQPSAATPTPAVTAVPTTETTPR